MSDDLVKRLRANGLDECDEAIDRIEELEAKLAKSEAEKFTVGTQDMIDPTDTRGQDTPSMGAFRNDRALIIEPAPNGGWTISQAGSMGERHALIGAYSDAADMLAALSENLTN
jgi:hypothetical protein